MFVWASIPAEYKDGYALSDDVLYRSGVFITRSIFGSAGDICKGKLMQHRRKNTGKYRKDNRINEK